MTDKIDNISGYVRTPSLRELRSKLPDNVVILPTATPRQVQQNYNKKTRKVIGELRKNTADRFNYQYPRVRGQADCARRLVANAQETARDLLLDTIFTHVLSGEQLKKIEAYLQTLDSDRALDAMALIKIARPMRRGDECDLIAAIKVILNE